MNCKGAVSEWYTSQLTKQSGNIKMNWWCHMANFSGKRRLSTLISSFLWKAEYWSGQNIERENCMPFDWILWRVRNSRVLSAFERREGGACKCLNCSIISQNNAPADDHQKLSLSQFFWVLPLTTNFSFNHQPQIGNEDKGRYVPPCHIMVLICRSSMMI